MITNYIKKGSALLLYLLLFCATPLLQSCEDFFDQESELIIPADHEHLNNAVDTIYSLTGILSKLEALGDRTILFGELRGDLVDYTSNADGDLVDIAQFNVNDSNRYNAPRDYYAVINNCNYYIEHADTALKNNRNEYIFMREYAVVKAIRAWTYLQLVLNYGSVPFVTKAILSKEDADAQYPTYQLQDVCDYFIADLAPLSPLYGNDVPQIGVIQGVDSRFFYYPLDVILGDLHLWAGGKVHAREAARCYHKFLTEHNRNSAYPTGIDRMAWGQNTNTYLRPSDLSWRTSFSGTRERRYSSENELITTIPGDSLPSEANYSQLRNYFNSNIDNDFKVCIKPSAGITELSESQKFCRVASNGTSVSYAPTGLSNNRSGDLRLWGAFASTENMNVIYSNGQTDCISYYQQLYKWDNGSRNVPILRKQMVYLRLAEALNVGGYPRAAFMILSNGLNKKVLTDSINPYCNPADTVFLESISFPTGDYPVMTADHLVGKSVTKHNTMGIHSRGAGWTPLNDYYKLPNDTIEPDDTKRAQLISEQQLYVDSLILEEGALECAFEGTRYYDLMRYCLRQSDPGKMMQYYIYGRRGKNERAAMASEIKTNLLDQRNWYLNFKGQFGLKTLPTGLVNQ